MPPYTAFSSADDFDLTVVKPRKTGWHDISAWTYTDTNCTEGESGYLKYSLHLVPTTQKTVRTGSPPFIAEYVGTKTSSAYEADTMAAANATCNFMQSFLSGTFIYKHSKSLVQFYCVPIPVAGLSTNLKIKYYMSATFQMNEELALYINSDFPTQKMMKDYLAKAFKGELAAFPRGPKLLDYLKKELPSTNLYYSTTEVRL